MKILLISYHILLKIKTPGYFLQQCQKKFLVIAKKFMHSPVEITVGNKNESTNQVSHEYYLVNARDRYLALKRLADANPDIFSVIFCQNQTRYSKSSRKVN